MRRSLWWMKVLKGKSSNKNGDKKGRDNNEKGKKERHN
jgi:hypothetical protein